MKVILDWLSSTKEVILAGAALLVALGAWAKWARPLYRRVRHDAVAFRDAILGRDALVHPDTGEELAPAQPGIGARMAHQEQQMTILTDAVARIADSRVRIDSLERRVDELERRDLERALARTESIELFRTMDSAFRAEPKWSADAPPGDA